MAVDRRAGHIRHPIPEHMVPDRNPGMNVNAGPYLGIVTNNVDPTRAGRLQVFVDDFGGVMTDPTHWVTVSYASPYMGASRRPNMEGKTSKENAFDKVNHTYGMWFTPPDIGNFVLIFFLNGDVNRGYWFSCILPEISQYAIPGQAGTEILEKPKDQALAEALTKPPYPCVEFNDNNDKLKKDWTNFLDLPKPVHEPQTYTLLKQGLEDDKIRGVVSSSSQRESPSRVFGISTPGREGKDKDTETSAVMTRLGGHTLVMDDGDKDGKDQIMRLRTAGGHQLLMSDTDKSVYIANSSGKVWMELTGDGKILVFAENSINVRSKNDINIHSDKDINMFAKDNIRMYAGTSIREESDLIYLRAETEFKSYGGRIGMKAGTTWNIAAGTTATIGANNEIIEAAGMIYMNTIAAPDVIAPEHIKVNEFKETIPTKPAPIYKYKHTSKVSSTIPSSGFVPTHEPYNTVHATGGSGSLLVTDYTPTPATRNAEGSSSAGRANPASAGGIPVRSSSGDIVTTGSGGQLVSPDYNHGHWDGDTWVQDPAPAAGPANAAKAGTSKGLATAADLANQPQSTKGVGSLSPEEKDALKAQIAKTESSGRYDIVGGDNNHFLGKYQMGTLALQDQGYVKPGTSGSGLDDPANWTGKDGVSSKDAFLQSPAAQEKAMDGNLDMNYRTLKRSGTITADSPNDDVAGKLAASHLVGAGGVNQWAKGTPKADAFGTTADKYYNNGKYSQNVLAANAKKGGSSTA